MRVLLVTQWYVPEPAYLIAGMASTLTEMGHDVTVLTGFPNYPSGTLYPGYHLKLWQRETIDGVKVVRVPLFPSHDASAFKRAINYVSYALSASFLGLFLVRRPHVIHVYHPPLTAVVPAWFLSWLFRVPFTLEIQDMWPETLVATGMVGNSRTLRAVGWMAKWFYRRAAAIRVISEGFSRNLQEKGVSTRKIRVIPNWTDTGSSSARAARDFQEKNIRQSGRFRIMFAGNMGLAQGLENVLDAAALLRETPEIEFVLVGDGVDRERLKRIQAERQLDNVIFLGRYPADEMPRLYADADALLVHLRDDPLFCITIPHKVYSYMASGKPVLVSADGDVVDTVVSANAGLACKAGDPEALAQTARQFWQMSPEERREMGENGKRIVQKLYNREHVVAQLESMICSVVDGR